jgi:dTDP-4-amino-4,6-dideoxygalactose transaminase
MTIPLLDLSLQYEALREELCAAVSRVADSQRFIGGDEVSSFEAEIAQWVGARAAVGCASGSDALLLALWALGIGAGDEVITTPFTFFATAGAVCRVGATPVFVDIEPGTLNIDPAAAGEAITGRTRALLPVHLFGVPADMESLGALAREAGISLVEDAAQSIGATYHGIQTGALGDLGCFSFFPSKNLGAWGDGGLVTTSSESLADELRCLRSHGSYPRKYLHSKVGCNSRLDALQAAILRVKLPHLAGWNQARRERAARYRELVREHGLDDRVRFQEVPDGAQPVYHQCVIRVGRRDGLRTYLGERGVTTAIYYPRPLHRQECFSHLGYQPGQLPEAERACDEVLALPIFPELSEAQQQQVVSAMAEFLDGAEQ